MARHRRRKSRDSNIFKIEFDVIETVLADVNSKLIEKSDGLISSAHQFPEQIGNNAEAEDLNKFIQNLRIHIKEIRDARLSDGRPFTEAAKFVKRWFLKTEKELRDRDRDLSERLSKYASLKVREAERLRSEIESNPDQPDMQPKTTIGISVTGDPVVIANRNPPNLDAGAARPLDDVPDVPLRWEVKSYDTNQINLEELRYHLTPYCIELALKKHLKEKGPNQLAGVEYAQVLDTMSLDAKNSMEKRDYVYSVDQVRKQHPTAYAKWIPEEEARLATLYEAGMSLSEIAIELGRQPGGIESRLRKLRLIE